MIPGVTQRPFASITRAPAGALRFGPTASILPFAINTSAPSSRVPVPVSTVAPRINVAVAAPARYVDGYGLTGSAGTATASGFFSAVFC